jgi:hypothetical protein
MPEWSWKMTNIVRNTLVACGFAGLLAAAAPGFAQTVVIGPYPYAGAYGAYGGPYVPRQRGYYRYQDYPAGYDTGGMPFSYRELGWQPGWPGSAPANPCTFGQRQQNRC